MTIRNWPCFMIFEFTCSDIAISLFLLRNLIPDNLFVATFQQVGKIFVE